MEILIIIMASQLPMVAHLLVDHYRMKTKKPIIHKRGATMVVLLSVILGLVMNEKHFLMFTFLCLTVHVSLFDILWNKVEGHKWNYLGTVGNPNRAWTDIIWSRLPDWSQVILRIVFLASGWVVYLKYS
jgi:hypothetical protein